MWRAHTSVGSARPPRWKRVGLNQLVDRQIGLEAATDRVVYRTSKPRQWPVAEWRINPSPIRVASCPRSLLGFPPRIVAPKLPPMVNLHREVWYLILICFYQLFVSPKYTFGVREEEGHTRTQIRRNRETLLFLPMILDDRGSRRLSQIDVTRSGHRLWWMFEGSSGWRGWWADKLAAVSR